MNRAFKTLFAGMLALVFSATAVAHDRVDGAWTGGLAVSVLPSGDLAWSGGVTYGAPIYQPVSHAVVQVPVHRVLCQHPSHYRHRGHGKKHGHGRKHRNRHVHH
jgi:hypothetical protein